MLAAGLGSRRRFYILRRGQFVRDWSEEGQSERNQCYGPILAELERIYPKETTVR